MDAEAFKTQFIPFHKKLYRIAYRFLENVSDAEDVVQETYAKLWEKRDELTDLRSPESFCIVMVKNRCMDMLRSLQNQNESFDPLRHEQTDYLSPLEELESKESLDLVEKLMNKLPEQQQLVMKLRHLDDCSLEEIEQATGLSAINIRVMLSRGRKAIREQFNVIYCHESQRN